MNPESPAATAGPTPGDDPTQTPAAASPAAPMTAPADAAPAMESGDASGEAPAAMAEPLAAASPEASPDLLPSAAGVDAAASSAQAPPAAPELSPAACGARLAELFPALFMAPGAPGPAKPIKLRIHADIQARAPGVFTKRVLGIFFSRYTTSNAYLKALASAAQRFDLDGQPAGEISDEHRQLAAEELARRHALAAERRAAQRPPRREALPAAEGEIATDAGREARTEHQRGPRPDARPDRRPEHRPAARPPQRPQGGAPRSERRGERGADAPPSQHSARPPRHTDRPLQAARPQRAEQAPPVQGADTPAALPIDPAQRERAVLLRSFESSPLSKANFCALKGLTEAALDAALAQAQAERGAPPKAATPRGGGSR